MFLYPQHMGMGSILYCYIPEVEDTLKNPEEHRHYPEKGECEAQKFVDSMRESRTKDKLSPGWYYCKADSGGYTPSKIQVKQVTRWDSTVWYALGGVFIV